MLVAGDSSRSRSGSVIETTVPHPANVAPCRGGLRHHVQVELRRRGVNGSGLLPRGPDLDDPEGLRTQAEVYSTRAFVRSQRRLDRPSWSS